MRVLLDTHTFLWFLLDDPKLSPLARDIIIDGANKVEISPASFWEIAIKISLGKYELSEPYQDFIEQELTKNAIQILPILPRHTAALIQLPFHHRDPFDRLIIAQAIVEDIPVLSNDAIFDAYPIYRIWNKKSRN